MNSYLLTKITNQFYKLIYLLYRHKLKNIHITSIEETIDSLINSNKSIGRFGDGEILWILQRNHGSFEKNSNQLSKRLLEVLNSNEKNFEITLPDAFRGYKQLKLKTGRFWRVFIAKQGYDFIPYLDKNIKYYNTSMSRCYIDYNDKNNSRKLFYKLKKIWNNKNVLIVEGNMSRLGVQDNLFSNAKSIARIECPSVNAFESYNNIFQATSSFLNSHNEENYLTLIALGPTATILSYDLFKNNHRAIDIGHVDVEYEWYLMGAERKVDLPYKYVNETSNGQYALPISNKKYYDEIVQEIK